MSPSSGSYYISFSKQQTLNKFTYRGPSKILGFFMKPSVKSTPPSYPLFNHKNVLTEQLITMAIFTYVRVLHFCSLVSYGPRNAVCLKTWGSTQCHVAFLTSEFCFCCFVVSTPSMAPSFLPCQRPVCIVSCIKSNYMAGGWGLLSCFMVCLRHRLCLLY